MQLQPVSEIDFGTRIVKPFGRKAAAFIRRPVELDTRINILEGAIRSSKTWTMLGKFPFLCEYRVRGHRLITGVSKNTIYNNILDDLFSVVGPSNYTYNRQTGDLTILGTKWLVTGAKDEGSEKYIRGLTVGMAYADELVLQPASFVKMLLNRMSPAGARFYATTNPDTPFHYVKTDLIDNEELRKNHAITTLHFGLEDNPNVSGLSDSTPEGKLANDQYKAHLNAVYKGVYNMRFVQGLWVVAEGGIYKDCWSDSLIYTDDTAPKKIYQRYSIAERYVPVDCGVDHPQVYLDIIDDGTDLWVDREYYWDSNDVMQNYGEGGFQKTDEQYANDLQAFLKKAPDAQVILPPETASFEAVLTQRGIWQTTADNEVLDGIKMVASMMSLGRLHFRRNKGCEIKCRCGKQCCTRTIKEIPSYVWDPKARMRGLEEPLKSNDDGCDTIRYGVKTKIAPWRLALAAA